jgi:DNA-binding phage protein
MSKSIEIKHYRAVKMVKKKTSKQQSKSRQSSLKKFEINDLNFKDEKFIKAALVDCLMNNEIDAFRDILVTHLRVSSKTKLVEETGVGRRTLYDLMDPSKDFNPRLKTVGAILEVVSSGKNREASYRK